MEPVACGMSARICYWSDGPRRGCSTGASPGTDGPLAGGIQLTHDPREVTRSQWTQTMGLECHRGITKLSGFPKALWGTWLQGEDWGSHRGMTDADGVPEESIKQMGKLRQDLPFMKQHILACTWSWVQRTPSFSPRNGIWDFWPWSQLMFTLQKNSKTPRMFLLGAMPLIARKLFCVYSSMCIL